MTTTRKLIAQLIDAAIAGDAIAGAASAAVQAVVVNQITENMQGTSAPRIDLVWQSNYNGLDVSVDGNSFDVASSTDFELEEGEAEFRQKYPDADRWLQVIAAAASEFVELQLDPRGDDGLDDADRIFMKHTGKKPDSFEEDRYSS